MAEGPLLILGTDHKPVQRNIDQLRSTLQSDQYRNLPVKAVSVAGMMRIGKSTMMNLFMRQLRAHEMTHRPIDELDGSLNNDTELKGFPRGGGTKAVTNGVYIWSRPFIVSDGNGDKSAVLLVDVEGAFDGRSIEESAPIFVFAALVSSAVLLNVERIDELVIQLLDCFVATGNAILQNVTIVVRNFSLEQTFGFAPGDELLEEKMRVTNSMDEAKRTSRERIRRFVSNLSCFLMPGPGEQAAEQNDWTNARPEFLSCTSDLLCAAIRPPKLVGEQPLKCADFVAFMEPFFTVFAHNQHPSTMTLFDTLKACVKARVITSAVQTYETSFPPEAMQIGVAIADRLWREKAIVELEKGLPDTNEVPSKELNEKLDTIRDTTKADIDKHNKREVNERRARFSIDFKKACQSEPTSITVYEAYKKHSGIAFKGLKKSLRGGPDADRFIKKLEKELAKERENQESLAEERRKTKEMKEMTETLAREREEAKRAEEKRKQEDEQRRKEDADRVAKAEEAKKQAEEKLHREREERELDRRQREKERLEREKSNETYNNVLKGTLVAAAVAKGACDFATSYCSAKDTGKSSGEKAGNAADSDKAQTEAITNLVTLLSLVTKTSSDATTSSDAKPDDKKS